MRAHLAHALILEGFFDIERGHLEPESIAEGADLIVDVELGDPTALENLTVVACQSRVAEVELEAEPALGVQWARARHDQREPRRNADKSQAGHCPPPVWGLGKVALRACERQKSPQKIGHPVSQASGLDPRSPVASGRRCAG